MNGLQRKHVVILAIYELWKENPFDVKILPLIPLQKYINYLELKELMKELEKENIIEILASPPVEGSLSAEYLSYKIKIDSKIGPYLKDNFRENIHSKDPEELTTKLNGKHLIISSKGKLIYKSNGVTYDATMNPTDNTFLLVSYIATSPYKEFDASTIEKKLNRPKHGGEDSVPERRVRDTVSNIRELLKLPKEELFLKPNKNRYSLPYPIVIDQ